MMRSRTEKVRTFAERFRNSAAGNVAMMYALCLVPMVAAVGAGIDMTQALVVRMRLGEALDAAGLAVGGTLGMTQAQMTAKAQQFFYANYPDPELGTVTSLTVTTGGVNNSQVTVAGTARVDTAFMRLFGVNYLDVGVNVQVTRESKGVELALVLDNTGSMASSGKLTALKSASNTLIDTLFGNQTTSAVVRMAVVPFSLLVWESVVVLVRRAWPMRAIRFASYSCQMPA